MARAESLSLDTVNNALKGDGTDQSEYMIAQKYIDMLLRTSRTIEEKEIYIPYPVTGLEGIIGQVSKHYGNFNSPTITPLSEKSFSNFQSSLEGNDLISLDQPIQPQQQPRIQPPQIEKGKEEVDEFSDLN